MPSIIDKRSSLHRRLLGLMKENKVLRSQVSELQALANIGTATCMMAHEMNNIMTPISTYAELALDDMADKEMVRKALEKAASSCDWTSKILASMIALANGEKRDRKSCRLTLLIDDIFTCLCRDFSKDKIKVKIEVDEDLTIEAVPVQMQQVLMNLILNARDAMIESGGTLKIVAEDCGNAVKIEISDTGCGINPDDINKIFHPFFSTKTGKSDGQRGGAGLGLAFCKEMVESHEGFISVDSKVGDGTTFKIILPKTQRMSDND